MKGRAYSKGTGIGKVECWNSARLRIASADCGKIDYTGASTVIINMKNTRALHTAKESHCESKQILICVV